MNYKGMKQVLTFFAGMFAGALLLYAIGFRSEKSVKEKIRNQLIEAISNNLSSQNQEADVQYVEVKGKKGNVTLHTGMSKDSVKLLAGKPDKVNLFSLRGISYETWGYKLKNDYLSDLDIEFENGKLKSIRKD